MYQPRSVLKPLMSLPLPSEAELARVPIVLGDGSRAVYGTSSRPHLDHEAKGLDGRHRHHHRPNLQGRPQGTANHPVTAALPAQKCPHGGRKPPRRHILDVSAE